ncbi:MAG: hypothetical protein V2I38_09585, partial [Alcanivoracaceae bacterium]|nr:hypothetical protein [Alcanivoracaceae bacterium]
MLSSLQRLLPSLVLAESLRFVAEPPGLVLHCESNDGAVGNAVSEALTQQAIAWQVSAAGEQYTAEQEWQLFRHADAVLTMIIPPGGSLPGELLATLAEWGVELRALRRLSPLDDSVELALEFYLEGWQNCRGFRPALADLAT